MDAHSTDLRLPWLPADPQPVEPGACGPNLEYEAEFLALLQAMQVQGEQQFGQTIIPAQIPDWARIAARAHELLQRSADIRLFVILAQARVQLHGLPALAAVVGLLARGLEQGWPHLHPRLDDEGEFDPLPRINALAALGDIEGLARGMRDARVLNHGHKPLSLRDVEHVLEGSVQSDRAALPSRDRLVEELRRAYAHGAPELQALVQLQDSLKRIQAGVEQRLGQEWRLPLDGIWPVLAAIVQVLDDPVADAASPAPSSSDAAGVRPDVPVPAAGLQAWQGLRVGSREEVVLLLDKLVAYFERHEPSHPAPMLLRRAQQLVPMGFHELIQDLAPGAFEQIRVFMPRQADTADGQAAPAN